MDESAQILEQVKKVISISPPKDQSQLIDQLERDSKTFPLNTYSASKPFITDAKQLADANIYKQFEDLAKEFIVTDNEEQSLKARQLLEDVLLPQNRTLKIQQPKLYEQYQNILVLFKYVCLPLRPLDEIDFLIKSYFLYALKAGINIEDKFDKTLFANDDVLNDANVAFRLSRDMLASTEKLGKLELKVFYEDKVAKPTLGNWLKDYLAFSAGSDNRGAFQRVSYLRQNKNALSLDAEYKDFLFQTLKIYDWLEFGNYDSNDSGDEDREGRLASDTPYATKQKFNLPEELEQTRPVQAPPSVPLSPKPAVSPGVAIKPAPLNIRDVLKDNNQEVVNPGPGLRMGGGVRQVESSKLKVESGNQNPADGQRVDGNKKTARLGAVSSLGPVPKSEFLTDDVSIAGSKNLSQLNQKPPLNKGGLVGSNAEQEPRLPSINSIAKNQKTAQLRAVSGTRPETYQPGSTLRGSVTDSKNLSISTQNAGDLSGGPYGNRTREALVLTQATSPDRAHWDESYHKQGVNQKYPQIDEVLLPPPSPLQIKQAEIDRKLEELEKKIKNKSS